MVPACHCTELALLNGILTVWALGEMHAVCVGVPASMAAARSWFEQGANMSSSEAYLNLGTIYLHGAGQHPCFAAVVLAALLVCLSLYCLADKFFFRQLGAAWHGLS